MDSRCRSVQLALVDVAGQVDRLAQAEQDHVAGCALCATVASAEQGLNRVLTEALPPADPGFEAAVLAALPALGWRRRAAAFLPVAVSAAVVLLGVLLVGGVPGGGLVSLLPTWSSQGWMALGGAAGDWGVAWVATARTAAAEMPTPALLAAAALSVGGLWLVVSVVRRWRRSPAWRRRDG